MPEKVGITIRVEADKLAALASVKQIVRDATLLYSEWLDSEQKLMKKPKRNDHRTHEDLVNEFFSI